EVYRRLIELELQQPHDPYSSLADWEAFRALHIAPGFASARSRSALKTRLLVDLSHFDQTTLLSFAVLSSRIQVWIADNRGIREFHVPYERVSLARDASLFTFWCSDPAIPIEKVKATGFRLYERLFAPFEAALDPSRTLIIQADGLLSRIPWHALT